MKRILLSRRLLFFSLSVMCLGVSNPAIAQDTTYDWNGSASTDFYAASNWTNAAGAVLFDNAVFRIVRTHDVGMDPTISQFIDWQPGIFDATGGDLNVNAEFNVFFNDKLNGTININDGGNFTCRNIIRIGREGAGTVNINSGGIMRCLNADLNAFQSVFIGAKAGGDGTVNVNDGGLLSGGFQVEVGTRNDFPTGKLNVNTGGTSEAYWVTVVGPNGTINVDGGTVNAGRLLIVGDLYVDPDGVPGTLGTVVGEININSGTVLVNQNDLTIELDEHISMHTDAKIMIDGGSLAVKRTGVDLTAALNAFIENGQIVPAAGKELVVAYDGVTTTVTAQTIAGIDTVSKNAFTVYPNPVQDFLTIQPGSDFNGAIDVTVTDLLGKTVIQQHFGTASGQNLDVSHLASGVYAISVTTSDTAFTTKIIKK